MTIPRIASYPMPDAATMPENRVDWTPDPARAVLLLHDLQDYFLDFFAREAAPLPELARNLLALRDACDAAGIPTIYTRQPDAQTLEQRGLLQDWWGPGVTAQPQRADVAAELAPRSHDTVLDKWRYSAFVSTDLRERMRDTGRDQLIVCGVYAHIGVMMTAADAFMHDIQPFAIGDAVADFSADEHRMALDWIARRCGVVIGHQRCIDAVRGPAGLPDSLDALRLALAQSIGVPVDKVGADDHPLHIGLDSIRLMALVERWTRDGAALTFVELAERETVADWWRLIEPRKAAA